MEYSRRNRDLTSSLSYIGLLPLIAIHLYFVKIKCSVLNYSKSLQSIQSPQSIIMCLIPVPVVKYLCDHCIKDDPRRPLPCPTARKTDPLTICDNPVEEEVVRSRIRQPCDDCIEAGMWVEHPETRRDYWGRALTWIKTTET